MWLYSDLHYEGEDLYIIFLIANLLGGAFIDVDFINQELKIERKNKKLEILILKNVIPVNSGIQIEVVRENSESKHRIPLVISLSNIENFKSETSLYKKLIHLWNFMMLYYAQDFVDKGITFLGLSFNEICGLDKKNLYFLIDKDNYNTILRKIIKFVQVFKRFINGGRLSYEAALQVSKDKSVMFPIDEDIIIKNRHKYFKLVFNILHMVELTGYQFSGELEKALYFSGITMKEDTLFNLDYSVGSIVWNTASTLEGAIKQYIEQDTHGLSIKNTINHDSINSFMVDITENYLMFINTFLSTVDETIGIDESLAIIDKFGYID